MLQMAFGIPIVIVSAAVLVIHILRFNKISILNVLNEQYGVAYATIINMAFLYMEMSENKVRSKP